MQPLNLDRTVTIGKLIALASYLRAEDEPEDSLCSEYDRGLVELIIDAAGLSMEQKPEVAKAVGVLGRCE